jgi:hypothetical protein
VQVDLETESTDPVPTPTSDVSPVALTEEEKVEPYPIADEAAEVAATGAGDLAASSCTPFTAQEKKVDEEQEVCITATTEEEGAVDTSGKVEEEEPKEGEEAEEEEVGGVGASGMVPAGGGEEEGAERVSMGHVVMEEVGSQGAKNDEGHEEEAAPASPQPAMSPVSRPRMSLFSETFDISMFRLGMSGAEDEPGAILSSSMLAISPRAETAHDMPDGVGEGLFEQGPSSAQDVEEATTPAHHKAAPTLQDKEAEGVAAHHDAPSPTAHAYQEQEHQEQKTVSPSPPSPAAPTASSWLNFTIKDSAFARPDHVACEAQEEESVLPSPSPVVVPPSAEAAGQEEGRGQQEAAAVADDAPLPAPQPQVRQTTPI